MSLFALDWATESIADALLAAGRVRGVGEVSSRFGFADLTNGTGEAVRTRDASTDGGRSIPEDIVNLVVAIVHSSDANNVNDALQRASFGATRINAQGGFMKRGNAVFLVGVRSAQTREVFDVIRRNCSQPTGEVGGQSSYGVMFGLSLISFDRI